MSRKPNRVTAERVAAGDGVVCVRQYVGDDKGGWTIATWGGDEGQLLAWADMMTMAGTLAIASDAESTFIRFDDRHGIAVVRDAQAGVVSVAVYMPSCPAIKSLRRKLRALNAAYAAALAQTRKAA